MRELSAEAGFKGALGGEHGSDAEGDGANHQDARNGNERTFAHHANPGDTSEETGNAHEERLVAPGFLLGRPESDVDAHRSCAAERQSDLGQHFEVRFVDACPVHEVHGGDTECESDETDKGRETVFHRNLL